MLILIQNSKRVGVVVRNDGPNLGCMDLTEIARNDSDPRESAVYGMVCGIYRVLSCVHVQSLLRFQRVVRDGAEVLKTAILA